MIFEALGHPHPAWKPADAARPWTPFSATYSQTLNLLAREVDNLRAREVRIQVVTAGGNTRGGNLRSDARVDHPGVIVTLDTKERGTLVYETDEFRGGGGMPGWHANLRAIALGLEALRKVERYGIARAGQQYAGYRELPSGIELGAATMTAEEAAQTLGVADPRPYLEDEWMDLLTEPGAVNGAFREAAKVHHPDAGGDPDYFRRIVAARDLLLSQMEVRA